MKIAIRGGGPGGLYAAILFSRIGQSHEITVWERNSADDTFGFGVVFSDETLTAFEAADPPTFARITESFARWSDIDIHYRGTLQRSGGHGFAALSRRHLLNILQARAADLGTTLHFRTEAPPVKELSRDYDLVVAADGVNSVVREQLADQFQPALDRRKCKFMWLGTDLVFDAFTFHIVETPWGVFQIHAYPYDETMSTFIVEADEATWRRAGLDATEDHPFVPGENDELAIAFCAGAFADILDGHALIGNNSRWLNFHTVTNQHWSAGNVVLLGDAAHTAHWSIGSGTKLAMEDAIALVWSFRDHEGDVSNALDAYQIERRPIVQSTQRAALASLEWFEGIGRYVGQDPRTFAFNLLTRSRRITHDNLRVRDAGFVGSVEDVFCGGASSINGRPARRPPMFLPLRLRELELSNRIVVSPMDMYSAVDGKVGDFHLVHLGSRAEGGAALVMTEMICISAEGRITPGCGGLYRDDHIAGWKRAVDFVHRYGTARIGAQIGHSGRKGSTKLMWEGIDQPLEIGGWDVIAPSPLPYSEHSPVPREMTRDDMDTVLADFVASTGRAIDCGFDLLELHMAHGYLLSSFLSPLTNTRSDEYGGSLEARAKFPLEVLDACRATWPSEKPLSVRISATDWVPGGFDGDDAVELAKLLRAHGCDIVDVSTGQVSADARPAYGRSFQTPYADRIRHEADIPTIAVGAISSWDDVNTTILAERADLCAIGRPHLYDPFWTLHAAAEQAYYYPEDWIVQYKGGSRRPMDGRVEKPKAPLRSFELAEVGRAA